MVKKVIVLAALAVSLVVPTTASASTFTQEMKAGNRAEQKLQNRYPGYSVYAVCDKQGSRFWCSVGGSRRSCFVTGHAWVYRYPWWRVRLVGVTRDCF
jgi:hypothetical protein